MANTYKNIVITPNTGSSTGDPTIVFSGANSSVNTDVTLRVYPESNGTLSFEGAAGQLFSITNDLTGSVFSVNDVSGLPLIEVNVTSQQITFGQFYGNVGIGTAAANASTYKLDVAGSANISSPTLLVAGQNIIASIAATNVNAAAAYTSSLAYANGNAAAVYASALGYANGNAATVYSSSLGYTNTNVSTVYASSLAYTNANSALEYASAIGYTNTNVSTVYASSLGYANANAATVYSTALGYANGNAASAFASALGYANGNAATVYTSALGYANGNAATAYNSSRDWANSNTIPSISGLYTYANGNAATAYTSSLAYTNANSALEYSSALGYANGNAAAVYASALGYANGNAAAVYASALGYANGNAATVYTSAVSNAGLKLANTSNVVFSGYLYFPTGGLAVGMSTGVVAELDLSGNYALNIVAVAASSIDCSAGNYFTKTISTTTTFTFDSVPASRMYGFVLELTNGGSATVSWPASVRWPGGTAPTLTSSGVDILTFLTDDGGTTWRGVVSMADSKTTGGTP